MMDDQVYRRLLSEQNYFVPQDQHRIVEITGNQITSRVVCEQDLQPWIKQKSFVNGGSTEASKSEGAQPAFRLLIGSPRVLEQNVWPLPTSRNTFQCLVSEWDVPMFMLRAICRHIPLTTIYTPVIQPETTGLLLRTNLSFSWQYSLAAIHDPVRNVTNCVIFGLKASEILSFLDAIKSSLTNESSRGCPLHLLIPTILMDIAVDVLSQDAEARRAHLLKVYQATGLHGFNQIDRRPSKKEVQLELDLLTKLTHSLTSLSDACAGIKAVCKMQFRFLDTLRSFGTTTSVSKSDQRVQSDKSHQATRSCLQHLHFMAQVLHGAESKLGYIQESAQCQVHTMYSLIEQRESRTHIEYADTSSRLAAQSHQIAELTRRDSIDMRIIAAVTMLFLPGTFMATLFSASFFNFQPRNDTARVSSWIWLYFTLTVVLTAIVLAGWYYFARHENFIAKKDDDFADWQKSIKHGSSIIGDKKVHEKSQRRDSMIARPYLSGSVAGIPAFVKGADDDDFFAKELEINDISPRNTFKSW